jgi:hypothetical protein
MANQINRCKAAAPCAVGDMLDIEDDLRILRGTLKALSMISVCQDEIHPEGLHVLARFGEEALDRVYEKWTATRNGERRMDKPAD